MCKADRRPMTPAEGDAWLLFTTLAMTILTVILSLSSAS